MPLNNQKTITICGSMHFFKEIQKLQEDLQNLDFTVLIPNGESLDKDYSKMTIEEQIEMKHGFIDDHIAKIKAADIVLVANFTKNGQENYIGANTFLELGFAYILNKKLFLLNDIPYTQDTATEILGLKPVALQQDLNKLVSIL
jgi:nucleoside 2-deoxyribosyltransferase